MSTKSKQNPSKGKAEEHQGLWARLLSQMGVGADAPPKNTAPKSNKTRNRSTAPRNEGSVAGTGVKSENTTKALERDLQRISGAQSLIAAGKIQILNIEAIAEHFGNKWPRLAERAHAIIDKILRSHLGSRDISRRYQDFIYIVVFADIDADEARGRMALISEDIREMLVGAEPGLASLDLKTATFAVNGDVSTSDYSVEEVFGILSEMAESVSPMADGSPAPSGETDRDEAARKKHHVHMAPLSSPQSLKDRLEEVKKAHAMIQARLDRMDDLQEETAQPSGQQMLSDLEAELLRLHERLSRRVPIAKETSTPAGARARPDVPETSPVALMLMEAENALMQDDAEKRVFFSEETDQKLTFSYRPAWHIGAQIIGTHFVLANIHDGKVVRPSSIAFGLRLNEDLLALLDRCLLRRALIDLMAPENTAKTLVCVAVHFSTLRHMSHRDTLMYLMRSIPQWCREYLVWEVMEAPKDLPRSQVDEIFSLLQSFGHSVIWRTSLLDGGPSNLSGTRVKIAGLHLKDKLLPEERTIELIKKWISVADQLGFNACLRGVTTFNIGLTGVEAGFDRLSGDAVRVPIERLGQVTAFMVDDFKRGRLSPPEPPPA